MARIMSVLGLILSSSPAISEVSKVTVSRSKFIKSLGIRYLTKTLRFKPFKNPGRGSLDVIDGQTNKQRTLLIKKNSININIDIKIQLSKVSIFVSMSRPNSRFFKLCPNPETCSAKQKLLESTTPPIC